MTAAGEKLMEKFRPKDNKWGVAHASVKALKQELDVSETQVVHTGLSKCASDELPAYVPDDGPLTAKQIRAIREGAEEYLPKGKVFSKETLFA